MANPKGNLATLRKYTPKWNSGETRTIRVPITLADKILEYAHQLDNNSLTQVNDVYNGKPAIDLSQDQEASFKETLTQVIQVIEKVCETQNTSKFSKTLKTKLEKEAIAPLKAVIQVKE